MLKILALTLLGNDLIECMPVWCHRAKKQAVQLEYFHHTNIYTWKLLDKCQYIQIIRYDTPKKSKNIYYGQKIKAIHT